MKDNKCFKDFSFLFFVFRVFIPRSLIDDTERDRGNAGITSTQESQNEQSEDNLSQVGSVQSYDSSGAEEEADYESKAKR